MRRLNFGRMALSGCIAAALFAGCGGPQSPLSNTFLGQPRAIERLAHVGSWIAPNSSGQNLIYMVQGNTVGMYTFEGQQVGELKGLSESNTGLCADSQGNVWVTYGDSLLEYAHAGTIPIAQVYTPLSLYSCAVDPTTGDIAATEYVNEGGAGVVVIQDIYGPQRSYTDSDFDYYDYCSYDDHGNLFVNGIKGSHSPLAELPSNGSALQTITVDEKIGKVGGLQWDGQYLALGDSLTHVVYQLSVAKGQASTKTSTHFKGWTGRFKTTEPFAIYNGLIVLTFSDRQTGLWKFPAGGRAVRRFALVTGAKTVSVAPTAVHRR